MKFLAMFLWLFAVVPYAVAEPVDIEIVLVVDNSSSIEPVELQAQREALRNALRSPNVINTIQSNFHQKIAIQLIEFSTDAEITVDWSTVSTLQDMKNFTDRFREGDQRTFGPSTYLMNALNLAYGQLYVNEFTSTYQQIFVIGDGISTDKVEVDKFREIVRNAGPKFGISAMYIPDQMIETKLLALHFNDFVIWGYKKEARLFSFDEIEPMLVKALQLEMF